MASLTEKLPQIANKMLADLKGDIVTDIERLATILSHIREDRQAIALFVVIRMILSLLYVVSSRPLRKDI